MRIDGLNDALKQFERLEVGLAQKTLRSASLRATSPIFKEMKSKIPVGSEAHKTYKGRLVGPGFAKRSLKRRSKKLRNGSILVTIGILSEAFYAIQFHDEGVSNISTRRIRGKRGKQPIRPYSIRPRYWFQRVFERGEKSMVNQFAKVFKQKIDQVTRNG